MIVLSIIRKIYLLKFLFLAGFFIAFTQSYSQTETWYFGNEAGIQFVGPSGPSAVVNSKMISTEGCASYTNQSLNKVYYSNGEKLWIGPNVEINGLNGNQQAIQSAVFVPKPQDPDTLYLFTLDANIGSGGLSYSVIVNQSIVNDKINISLMGNVTERMCVIQHCNNRDAWLIVHGWNNNLFYAFQINGEGIDTVPVISAIGSVHNGNFLNATGYLKANSQGNRLAIAKMGSGTVELFHFDNINGTLSNAIEINNLTAPYGVEFNNTSSLLFVSTASGNLSSFDLSLWNTFNVNNSKQSVVNGGTQLGALQMGPDNKIYVARDNANYIGQIGLPENPGTSCLYNETYLYLNGKKSEAGLPPFSGHQSSFQAYANVSCFGDTTKFRIEGDTMSIDSVRWDFGDNSTSLDYSIQNRADYVYPYFGLFSSRVLVYHCYETDTLDLLVQVLEIPKVDLGNDTSLCKGQSVILSTIPSIGTYYTWQNGNNASSIKADKAGFYWLTASSQCGTDSDTIEIKNIWNNPEPNLPSDTLLCIGDSIVLDGGDYTCIWQHHDTSQYYIVKDPMQVHICVIDSNNCVGHDDFQIYFDSLPESKLGNDTSICLGKSIKLNGGHAQHFEWQDYSTGQYLTTITAGTYYVRLDNTCGSLVDSIDVKIEDCLQRVFVPTAFTPNGDYINDEFLAVATNITDYSMHIYNNWGHLLFESYDLYRGWDGRDRKGEDVNLGTYVYIIRYRDHKGNPHTERGFINLLR